MLKVIDSKTTKCGRFTIVTDQVEKNGNQGIYDYIRIPSGVSVLPILPNNHVLLQKEYRHPVHSWQYELPSGLIDEGETPDEAAVREVREETGYEVDELIPLGKLHPSFGATDETIYLYAARLGEMTGKDLDPLEEIETDTVSIDTFKKMIADGTICHGGALAAWARWTALQEL